MPLPLIGPDIGNQQDKGHMIAIRQVSILQLDNCFLNWYHSFDQLDKGYKRVYHQLESIPKHKELVSYQLKDKNDRPDMYCSLVHLPMSIVQRHS